MNREDISRRIEDFAVELTEIRSVVGLAEERDVTKRVYEQFQTMTYFQEHPDQLRLITVPEDPLERHSVVAMVKGKKGNSRKTVILIGHTDTVGTSDYGVLEAYATKPKELPAQYHQLTLSEDAARDLASGEYIFGRGIFDMKTGVSILVHVVEELSRDANALEGNIIFAAVCDEEGNSGGMLSVLPELVRLKAQEDFDYQAMIDADYMAPRFDGDETHYIYLGTVGKLMPSFYVVGSEAHAGDPFRGMDPNQIAAAIVDEMNFNMDYAEEVEGEVTVPPISLRLRDLKPEYSVQTAKVSHVYFNFSTHASTPDELLNKIKAGAQKAFQAVIDNLRHQYQTYAKQSGFTFHELPWKARVMSYAELLEQVKKERGVDVDQALEDLQQRLLEDKSIDERQHALKMVERLHSLWSDQDPVVIAYYSPPYYPHIHVGDQTAKECDLVQAIDEALAGCANDYPMAIRKFYPYISDLSYAAAPHETGAIESLRANMPGFGVKYRLPLEDMRQLNLPVVNIGPYGKDAHKYTERVHRDYSYRVVPELIWTTIQNLLR